MSKIFEALHRNQGPVPDEILSSLFEGDAPEDGPIPELAVQPEEDIPAATAPPEPVPMLQPILSGIRTLPVHPNGSAPLLPFENAASAAAEQYRIIRTRL